MTEAALRALVRDVVARQLGIQGPVSSPADASLSGGSCTPCATPRQPAAAAGVASAAPLVSIEIQVAPVAPQPHVSHAQFSLGAAAPGSSLPCVIEPAVPCDHCGYCKSLGH